MEDRSPLLLPTISKGAGFWIRMLARLIDTVYGLVLGIIGGLLGGIILVVLERMGAIESGWQHRIQELSFVSFGLSLLGGFLYHLFSEGINGASLGKLICQLRVLADDGQPCTVKKACVRTFGFYFDSLIFGAVGYSSMQKSPLNQRYGDVWAKTIVVKTKDFAGISGASVAQVLFGISLGSGCWLLMLTAAMVLKGLSQ